MSDRLTAANAPVGATLEALELRKKGENRWEGCEYSWCDARVQAILNAYPTAKIVVPEVEEKVVEFVDKIARIEDTNSWGSVSHAHLGNRAGERVTVAIIPKGCDPYNVLKKRLGEWERWGGLIRGAYALGEDATAAEWDHLLAAMPKETP